MKNIIYTIFISLALLYLMPTIVLGFENETFKIDVPETFGSVSYNGITAFSKKDSDDTGILIYSVELNGLKKDFSTMSKSEIEDIMERLGFDRDVNVIEQGKEKLGKSKAIKSRVSEDDIYMDVYIVTSDKHVLLINFMAPTLDDLDGEDFNTMKKSFKMKERSTNATLVKGGGLALVAGGVLLRKRKNV